MVGPHRTIFDQGRFFALHAAQNVRGDSVRGGHEHSVDGMHIPARDGAAGMAEHCGDGGFGEAEVVGGGGKAVAQDVRCQIGQIGFLEDLRPLLRKSR